MLSKICYCYLLFFLCLKPCKTNFHIFSQFVLLQKKYLFHSVYIRYKITHTYYIFYNIREMYERKEFSLIYAQFFHLPPECSAIVPQEGLRIYLCTIYNIFIFLHNFIYVLMQLCTYVYLIYQKCTQTYCAPYMQTEVQRCSYIYSDTKQPTIHPSSATTITSNEFMVIHVGFEVV